MDRKVKTGFLAKFSAGGLLGGFIVLAAAGDGLPTTVITTAEKAVLNASVDVPVWEDDNLHRSAWHPASVEPPKVEVHTVSTTPTGVPVSHPGQVHTEGRIVIVAVQVQEMTVADLTILPWQIGPWGARDESVEGPTRAEIGLKLT